MLDTCNGRLLLGDALAAQSDIAHALETYKWAAQMLGLMTAAREAAAVWRSIGDRLLEHGDLTGALDAYDQALADAGIRSTTFPVIAPQGRATAER